MKTTSPLQRCRTCLCVFAVLFLSTSCGRQAPEPPPPSEPKEEGLVRVGSLTIFQQDLDHHLNEKYSSRTNEQARESALRDLVRRARFAQAGLDAGLARDPVVRAEMARLLGARLREQQLYPKIKALADIPEARLREIYVAEGARFQSNEQRQVAVLWLNPGRDPEREKTYVDKLTQAREWLLNDKDLANHPEKGFSILGVDYSEHHASRFKNGVVGWLERAGGMDAWRKAVAEIAFSLEAVGEVSPVITRPEGVFLVRVMDRKAPVQRSFESVAEQLEGEERSRLRQQVESNFTKQVEATYAVEGLAPGMMSQE